MNISLTEPWRIFKEIIAGPWITSGLDVQWKVITAGGYPFLAFQGSTSKTDWKNNFTFFVKPYKNQKSEMLVHKGFAKAWKSCNDEVIDAFVGLTKLLKKEPVIVGHSFGGAMAVLAGEDFFFRTGKKPTVITFGAPKVVWGKKSFEHVNNCVFAQQFAERNDIVPFCPPIPGYKHISEWKIGDGFNVFKLFNPGKYHQIYGEHEEYFK